ncbi:MAG TPA: hypothetical protein VKU40_06590, partial [Thermoanaerobaculia bacterium]|nr:hypothetical protein [Thermoanaerobaculia bacterium]
MRTDARTHRATPFLCLLLAVAAGLAGWRVAAPAQQADLGEAPIFGDPYAALTELGYSVTGGAAAGYVDDGVCATCHADLAATYAEVGMARSFHRPRAATGDEDFESGFFHSPSQRHYRMLRDGEGYLLRRYQLDAAGEEINVLEQPVDFVIGSGNHSRLYAYRNAAGELFQLPLAWYSQEGGHWGMAPGFELGNHQGIRRQVRRECMFCHNAYPDVPAGSDEYRQPHVFPERLPQGIGCQRCHGPGARHAALAFAEAPRPAAVRAAIVNPARLEPARRDAVCESCHLQPASQVFRPRRFDRADYSFRPGQPLEDFLVPVDVELAGHPPEE